MTKFVGRVIAVEGDQVLVGDPGQEAPAYASLESIREALAARLGDDSVSGIFGGQFSFSVELPTEAIHVIPDEDRFAGITTAINRRDALARR